MNTTLNFIFSHLYAIILVIWILFLIIVVIRFWRPAWVKNISYLKLFWITLGIHIIYGLFLTWGQSYVWANGNAMTEALLNLPLPSQVPFPSFLEWLRPLFEHSHGYFWFYVWGRFWFNIFLLFLTGGVLYSIFRAWKHYRGGFSDEGPLLLLILMLISGWPGVLVSVTLGFILAVLLFGFHYLKSYIKKVPIQNVVIEPAFILSTLVALLFTNFILKYML